MNYRGSRSVGVTIAPVAGVLAFADIAPRPSAITIGEVTINRALAEAEVFGRPLHLTRTEYRILEHLFANRGVTISKAEFMALLYDGPNQPAPKIIDVLICKIRRKITKALGPVVYIETIWGRGYVVSTPRDDFDEPRFRRNAGWLAPPR